MQDVIELRIAGWKLRREVGSCPSCSCTSSCTCCSCTSCSCTCSSTCSCSCSSTCSCTSSSGGGSQDHRADPRRYREGAAQRQAAGKQKRKEKEIFVKQILCTNPDCLSRRWRRAAPCRSEAATGRTTGGAAGTRGRGTAVAGVGAPPPPPHFLSKTALKMLSYTKKGNLPRT